ncbi:ABC transporter ATP-binding protein [Candidatus Rhodobacter oscarellae]|uniref:ABC transporter ATP-binding protein n=1 Tax=Candidatus Rhodobacter oscarellae TaxID=1675527 RepID=A0A0J9GRN8_9RHOB|nr:ABC transporter ATP-binding protein [Candidatus Rhodobacter lobularis]KMW56138.1 ABC transporter ATP-binding protein [Candidatus Rhodobacter lobularis]
MLEIRDLRVQFETRNGTVDAVRGIDLDLARGETLGIVGESGSGKSVTAFSMLRILDAGGEIASGRLSYGGIDLAQADDAAMNDIRGREISMIFQNPRAALNPVRKVGHQIEDVLRQHAQATAQDARDKAIAALQEVEIKDAAARYHAYPFELSGGMCQRVVIALALACRPQLLIADEPTTGLDVTTQKTVMDLIQALAQDRQMGVILITHDLGLAGMYCDQLVVMKDGEIVEKGAPGVLTKSAAHAYTKRLLAATPHKGKMLHELVVDGTAQPLPAQGELLLSVQDVTKTYEGKSGAVHALRGVSFDLHKGGCLGLVGESGSGKSTVSSIIARLQDATTGDVQFAGASLFDVPAAKFASDPRRSQIQMVFQDATDSLNPRHTAAQCIEEPLRHLAGIGRRARRDRVQEIAGLVGLPDTLLSRLPHQLSGGQKARVGIARALAVEPQLLILDEPTAALDVSIQAVVLNLLAELRHRLRLTYLFVSHDLAVVQMLCDNVVVMRSGKMEEIGPTRDVLASPQSAYTQQLLDAMPSPAH